MRDGDGGTRRGNTGSGIEEERQGQIGRYWGDGRKEREVLGELTVY